MASIKIDINELKKLNEVVHKNKLRKVPVKSEHEILRVKDKNINLIVYKSGKIVYNDNEDSKGIISSILKKDIEYDYLLGSDETGKGEWFGPLVVVATALKPDEVIELRKMGVQDSKLFKKNSIIKLARKIIKLDFARYSRPLVPETYNRLYNDLSGEGKNLNDLMAWAHSLVIKEILRKIEFNKAKLVIDKFDFQKTEYRLQNIDKSNLEIIQKTRGESEIPVATASIIAKYLFELEVDKMNEKYDIDLRKSKPEDIDPELLPLVSKLHFKNVNKLL